ncbi:hypothetical protein [Desulfitibacter alkalitolerans]|uniref:hypothetical protein n=1 Tax=Desulfitibacter alkalitolerans TaxID=264641 RepID=UPI0012EC0A98|nr:hypothetical protein [Desulfitibacter alkalitolerans]
MQSWQEGRADNLDANNPLVLNIYLPAETKSIKRAILRFRRLAFRAYEKAAASGGGGTTTSESGGGTTQTSAPSNYALQGGYLLPDWMYLAGSHNHGGNTGSAGGHNHGITDGTVLRKADGGSVTWYQIVSHLHSIGTDGSHAHARDTDHKHNITIPGHTHSVSIPAHTHALDFGIYTSVVANGVTIKINGVDRTTALGGPFNSDQSSINIAQYLNIGQWNAIELGISSALGRLDATIFLQALMGV